MKDLIVGVLVGAIAIIGAIVVSSQTKCVAPSKPDATHPGLVAPGTALIANGEAQAAWVKLGSKTRIWIGDAKEPKSVVELVLENGTIQVIKDGRQGAGVGP